MAGRSFPIATPARPSDRQNLGRFGAYSLDLTHARSQLADNQHYTGDSVRLRYSKLLNDIGTRVNFFSLRYSTAGFYTLSDTTYKGMAGGAPEQTVEDDGTVTTHYDTVYNLHMSRKAKSAAVVAADGRIRRAVAVPDQQTYWNTSKPRKVCSSRGTRRFVTCRLASAPSVALACTTTRKTISSRCPCRCRWVTRRCRPVSVLPLPMRIPLAPPPVPVSVVICRGRRIFL